MTAQARQLCRVGLHVLIRARAGEFVYEPAEIEAMLAQIAEAKALGVDGVALGCLTADGRIDAAATARLVEAARPLSVTFHRAIDQVNRDVAAEVRRLGIDRVLSSGGAATAEQGIAGLRRWVEAGVGVIAAGAVRIGNARRIVAATGVGEIHAALHRLTTDHSPAGLAAAVRALRATANGVSP